MMMMMMIQSHAHELGDVVCGVRADCWMAAVQDELLAAFSPEVRATAQHTYGNRLEQLTDLEELTDFLQVGGVRLGPW
jgi:hypothetical protein